ncbi:DUF2877 domain-containing protein [Serratia rubidaea]|uniref:DUF2877 domain-containing protein n=1 Tax=Serratia rubidaea TaxID=61652 RepID=UPI0022B8E06B|nr:DUF2877 domain-containing protein [Serratia rubidaea]WBF44417.1 DUF2877 domain-containing protein [Serratia rubidaea]
MNAFKPLAISQALTFNPTSLHCLGIFSKAINLLSANQELWVLQRSGSGISPMGVVLRSADFNTLTQKLRVGDTLHLTDSALYHPCFLLRLPARRITLTIPLLPHFPIQQLETMLAASYHHTGLFGPLAQAWQQTPTPWLQDLRANLQRWLTDQPYNFIPFIGLGPGLTPSSDDMLVGMMALLHGDRRTRQRMYQRPMLPPALHTLTTSISQSYLQHAVNGRFSSVLITLLQKLARSRGNPSQISRFLTLGHHSGADTLLGLVKAAHWLDDFYQRTDANA